MDTDSFVINIKTEDFYEDIVDDIEKWFDTSKYSKDDNTTFPIGCNKKVIGLFKDELGGKIMEEFVSLREITWTYLIDDGNEHKKLKNKKTCNKKRSYIQKLFRLFIKQ